MSPEQKGSDPKNSLTGTSGRESAFDRRLREFRNTGSFAKPQRKALQFIKNPTADFEMPSMDSKLHTQKTKDDEYTEIERMAFIDESSGMLNARTIMGKIATEMRRSARYKHNFSILVIELDGFSNIASMTPLAVEMIFSSFCKIISKQTREVDLVGRFDESSLLIVCPETSLSDAVIEAERLRHSIASTHFKQVGHHNAMTVSIGISTFPEHGNSPVDMLGAAMEAAQHAVAAGGNNVCTARTDAPKMSEMNFASDEDFSPSSITKLTEELATEDMSPTSNRNTGMAFPTVEVSPLVS